MEVDDGRKVQRVAAGVYAPCAIHVPYEGNSQTLQRAVEATVLSRVCIDLGKHDGDVVGKSTLQRGACTPRLDVLYQLRQVIDHFNFALRICSIEASTRSCESRRTDMGFSAACMVP